ncbi:hypothetical protein NL676_025599 [Syzygium grande]|nr:hypothetical protein NL676_025599 [Syzygium grande]
MGSGALVFGMIAPRHIRIANVFEAKPASPQKVYRGFYFLFPGRRRNYRIINGMLLGSEHEAKGVSRKSKKFRRLRAATFDPDGLTGPVTTFGKARLRRAMSANAKGV